MILGSSSVPNNANLEIASGSYITIHINFINSNIIITKDKGMKKLKKERTLFSYLEKKFKFSFTFLIDNAKIQPNRKPINPMKTITFAFIEMA